MTATRFQGDGPARQVLMLGLGDEIFAIGAELVREIIDPVPSTRVAGAKPHLPAVINVRGNIVPLADMRVSFGMSLRAATPDTRVVVVEVPVDGDPVMVGLMADKVYEVTELADDDLQLTPRVGLRWPPEFIRSFATWKNRFIVVPELEHILA